MTKAAVQKHTFTLLINFFKTNPFYNCFLFRHRFTAKDVHFPGGELRLECTAEIEGVWKAHIEGVALGGSESTGVVRMGGGLYNRQDRGPNRLLVRDTSHGAGAKIQASSSSMIMLALLFSHDSLRRLITSSAASSS